MAENPQLHKTGQQTETMVYAFQFLNIFDESNHKALTTLMTKRDARESFLRIYKTSEKDQEKQIIPLIAEQNAPWLYDNIASEELDEKIEIKEFITVAISSVLYSLRNELGLRYELLMSRDYDEVFCKIFVTEEWLRHKADYIDYNLQFPTKDKNKFDFQEVAPYGPSSLATKRNNSKLFLNYDENDRVVPEGSLFTYPDKARILIDVLLKRFDLHALKNSGVIKEDFCLHQENRLEELKTNWARFRAILKPQPFDDIRAYFSEKVALYFAWIGTYQNFMLVAAVLGVFVFIGTLITDNVAYQQGLQIAYAVFLAFWGSTFDQIWTRREKTLAWRWGTVGLSTTETQRGEYQGEFIKDEVTGKLKIVAKNDFKAKIINFFSYSCIITFILLVIVAVGAIFVFRKLYKATLEAAVLNAVQIKVFNYIYGKVAIFLNDKENHETENLYNNNLALKLFLFKFVNSYSGLFYLAFVQQPYEGTCSAKGCLYDLGYQLCIIFATNMSLNIMELGLPYLTMKWNERSENKKIEKEMKEEAAKSAEESSQTDQKPSEKKDIRKELYPVEKNSKLSAYESPLDDYMEMANQFGYVALFGSSFALVPLLALIEITIEIRVDA